MVSILISALYFTSMVLMGDVTEFNNYFADIAQKIVDDRKWEGNSTFKDYWSTRNPNSLAFYPTDKDEVTKIINNLDSNKANGPNSIPNIILKNCSNQTIIYK